MDQIGLKELLVVAVGLSAAVILIVLRGRRRPVARPHVPPPAGSSVPLEAGAGATAQPIDLVELARTASAERSMPVDADRWPASDRQEWQDRVEVECARGRRYGRPAAIVEMRLDGIDALADEAGPEVAAWLSGAVMRHVRAGVRESDLVQVDGHASIRMLLAETDEDGARACVERAYGPLAQTLQDTRAQVRLVAGWAGTSTDSDLHTSERLARARLDGTSAGRIRSVAAWP